MTLFRIHIKPNGGLRRRSISFNYCLKEKVLGLGWQTKSTISGAPWDEYEKEAIKAYGRKKISGVRYLKEKVKRDDLVWTRDQKGNYYLAKVFSGWEYYTSEEARDADIANIFRCEIIKVQMVDDVPGKVIASFRPTRTIQSIKDNAALIYSKHLWNNLTNTNYYDLVGGEFSNVFSLFGSEETEDILFIYLQFNGWIVVPNSRKADTMRYEYYLIHRETKERAIVQVKTGHTKLDPKTWNDRGEKVILFQSNNKYCSPSTNKIICIDPKEIECFMLNNKSLLPSSVVRWLNMADQLNNYSNG